ncbi:MAG: hypothetical protein WD767_13525 [Alphaproteobacteria bacterium]
MNDNERIAALARARDYPYPLPNRSYTWRGGAVHSFDPDLTRGRTPVLAVGSNQAPAQLTRKFGPDPDAVIPVQRCALRDFDVVYSAHVAGYGSVPAMLQSAPGVTVTLFVNWLSEDQLPVMHATELGAENYHYGRLDDIDLTLEEGGGALDSVHGYISRRGHVFHAENAVALARVPATGRQWVAMTTAEMLEKVHARLAPDHALEEFILRLISDTPYRRACIEALSTDSVAFGRHYHIVAG